VQSWHLKTAMLLLATIPAAAFAQRTGEDVVASAEDAFGSNIGNERVGLYSPGEVRGFSPITAGNIRIEGVYIDRPADFTGRLVERSTVRVGLTAQNYLFPAPTGVVDYQLRSASAEPVVSAVVGFGPFEAMKLEVDGSFPIAGQQLIAMTGASISAEDNAYGTTSVVTAVSAAFRWRPSPDVEVIPFWSQEHVRDREPRAVYVTAGPFLPPEVRRHRYTGPEWAAHEGKMTNLGMIGKAVLADDWRVVTGLFRSSSASSKSFSHQLVDVTKEGAGRRVLHADPPRNTTSWSGEARVSRSFTDGERLHTIHLSGRARDRKSSYGGAATIDLGRGEIEQPSPLPRPDYSFGLQTFDSVKQWTVGAAYEAHWRGVGSLSLGVQQTDYRKTVTAPNVPVTGTRDQAWLYNGTLAIEISPNVAVYAGYSRGLEESGVAPDSAVNRTQALPAIHTTQVDAGVRWVINPDIRAVLGVFDVRKPYFGADERNVFTELGEVTHRGVEFSLTGELFEGFNLVTGAVLLDPRLTGDPVEQGRVGRRPIGQTRRFATLSANYALAAVPGLTLTSGISYHGGRVADRLNLLRTPAVGTLAMGARYRFELAGAPALLQAQVSNVTDVFEWQVASNSAYAVNSPRTFQTSLTVDF